MSSADRTNSADIGEYRQYLQAAAKSPLTIYLRTWQLQRFSEVRAGALRTATTADLVRYFAEHDWAPATLNSHRATFMHFYGWLCKMGKIKRDPAAALPRVRVPKREPRPATEEAIREAHTDERVRLMLDLGARQGLRRAEIAGLNTRDVVRDGAGWSLIVRGKGDKDRTIPLHPDIAERILAHPRGWVFPSPQGGHLKPNTVGCLISLAMPPGWTAHSLRKRFATQVFSGSHDISAVQKLLGHASVETTMVYVGVRSDQLRAALRYS